jgi:hypothetical protein
VCRFGSTQRGRRLVWSGSLLVSQRLSLQRPNKAPAVRIRLHLFDADQLAAKLFDRVVIETVTEPYTTIGNATLGHEAPQHFLQYSGEIHDGACLPPPTFSLLRAMRNTS